MVNTIYHLFSKKVVDVMTRKKIVRIIGILILAMLLGSTSVFADDINTGGYTGIYHGGSQSIRNAGSLILGVVQVVGTSIAVIMLVIIAIRYFTAAPEAKADIKSQLIPYVIGAVLLFAASNLVSIVATAAQEIF